MNLPPRARAHFAEKHIDRAIRLESEVAKQRAEDSKENQRAYERFYNNLALFSGGTIALSVTFLGYLKTLSTPITHPRLLMASWISLFICLSSSLFWTLFFSHYGHFARNREYCEATRERYETEMREIVHLNLVNLSTPQELAEYNNPRALRLYKQATRTPSGIRNAKDSINGCGSGTAGWRVQHLWPVLGFF